MRTPRLIYMLPGPPGRPGRGPEPPAPWLPGLLGHGTALEVGDGGGISGPCPITEVRMHRRDGREGERESRERWRMAEWHLSCVAEPVHRLPTWATDDHGYFVSSWDITRQENWMRASGVDGLRFHVSANLRGRQCGQCPGVRLANGGAAPTSHQNGVCSLLSALC